MKRAQRAGGGAQMKTRKTFLSDPRLPTPYALSEVSAKRRRRDFFYATIIGVT